MTFDGDYYIGLDCGTESVGFAVTDTSYNILKFNGKAMWGAHLFEEAETAEARRVQRCARRRIERRRERLNIAQSLFSKEIDKVDPTFFLRLNDSALFLEDKHEKQKNSIFNDTAFSDKEYFKQYPTIFHLRYDLYKDNTEHDVRLVYLAVHHILKNRGHFLFPGDNLHAALDLSSVLDDFKETYMTIFDSELNLGDYEDIEKALQEQSKGKRKEVLSSIIDTGDKKQNTTLLKLLMGNKVNPSLIFGNEEYKELPDINFSSASFDDQVFPALEASLDDDELKFIQIAKAIYDWAILAFVMAGHTSISEAKVALFDSNKEDLMRLKRVLKKHLTKAEYEKFFHTDDQKGGSFSNYIGEIQDGRHKGKAVKRCNIEVFYKTVKSLLGKVPDGDEDKAYILDAIDNETFLPLLISFRNGSVPYQVNKLELEKILENASTYLPFLNERDESGLSVKEKLVSLLTFRIPYYVGPLGKNENNKNTWMVRKKEGKILPWNFKDMVDIDASAEGFIRRMTSKCTYLPSEDVIPKNSLLYSKYLVLNDLNNIRVNGDKLDTERKQQVYKELFCSLKKVTKAKLEKFMIANGWFKKGDKIEITGIDGDFKSSLSSYIDFKPYMDCDKLKNSDVEEIIKWITLFGDATEMTKKRIKENFGTTLTNDDINKILRLKYAGWGRFSEKFLAGITTVNNNGKPPKSISSLLWEGDKNLMEVIYSHEFSEKLGNTEKISKLDYSVVEDLYVSPSVKRQIWQTLRIVDEIEKIMKKPPKKVFLEVTRGAKGKRTISRKNALLNAMKNGKKELPKDIEEIIHSLESFEESDISKRDKLYLYFSQCGKCMYTGRPIDISDIGTAVDVDHIYPISLSGDDSLNNRVLVYSEYNREKTNEYPIKENIRANMASYWNLLKEKGLISKVKYDRLVRSTPLAQEELEGFAARQIVETSQNNKATADILKRYFGDETKIVYSKARNVSEFRDKYDIPKSRSVNSLHHAHDAYLNIVVGNILDAKYTANYFMNITGKGYYNISKKFDYSVEGAWDASDNGTIVKVKSTLSKNNVLFTRQLVSKSGKLFDLNLIGAGDKKGLLPAKLSNPILQEKLQNGDREEVITEWTNKYGGYNSLSTAYFALVRHEEKGKAYASFVPISIIDSKTLSRENELIKYCESELGFTSPSVLYSKLLINTPIKINGYPLSISGKSSGGAKVTLRSRLPLKMNNSSIKYVKKIDKYLERKKNYKNYELNHEYDGITEEKNIELYNTLMEKANAPIYLNRPGSQVETLNNGIDKFIGLSLDQQCIVLNNIITYFAMGLGLCDLSLIGGIPKTGTITSSSNIDLTKKDLTIVFESITGLFSEEVRIK